MDDPLQPVLAKSADPAHRWTQETLTGHTSNVLARLAGWRMRYPDLPNHTSRADLWALAGWAVVLHDVGKAARGFQEMLRGGPIFRHRHEALSLLFVGRLDLDVEARGLVAAGVGTHHRDASELHKLYVSPDARSELLAELSADDEQRIDKWLANQAAAMLGKYGLPAPPVLRSGDRAPALAAGLRALRDLTQTLFAEIPTSPANLSARAIRGLVVLADHAGSAHEHLAAARSLDGVAAFLGASSGVITRALEHHQQAASETEGNALLVAPTGSGKTEAAMLWAARQRQAGDAKPVVFYVLPYRASLNAMRARLPTYGIPESAISLQHAKATSSLYARLLDKEYAPARAAAVAKRERDLGRLMTTAVRVLTPYQLLRAVFGLPGHEAMLTDAAGGLFILDELHAYDLDRLALILAGLRHLARDCGARVLAMSATMPSVLQVALAEALGPPLPLIEADEATKARYVRHALRIAERDLLSDASLDEMERRFRRGEAVLVVASTVGRSQQVYDEMQRRLGDGVSLLHSRFTGRDRAKKEQALAARIGTRTRTGAPTLLVATQVVEVSLDVDFDVLFSDPAPIEALLQRFGRINRGCRGGLRDVIVHTHHPEDATFIYPTEIVARALDVLRPNEGTIDEGHVQRWVDACYEPIATAWRKELSKRLAEATHDVIETNRPLESRDLERYFDLFEENHEVVPESLAGTYEELLRREPLDAVGLLVPISHGQWHKLRREGRLETRTLDRQRYDVARVAYDEDRGLDLDAASARAGN